MQIVFSTMWVMLSGINKDFNSFLFIFKTKKNFKEMM